MSIVRHDSSSILSNAVEHGGNVYLAGVVAKNLDQDIKGQTKEILDESMRATCRRACVEAKPADPRALVEIMVVAAK